MFKKNNFYRSIILTLTLIFGLSFFSFSQYDAEITKLLKDVKEASYYDSTHLMIVGQKAILKANETNQKKAIAEVYLYYGNHFYYTRNINKAKFFLKISVLNAAATKNKHIETLANIRIKYIDYEYGENDNAEQELYVLLDETKRTKDDENYLELLNLLGIIKESKNQLQEAAKLYVEGLSFSESNGITHYPAVFRNNLGLIKLYTDQVDEALIDFEKALASCKKENDKNLANHLQINMCLIYVQKNRIPEALKIFEEIISYARTNNHPRELASAFTNLASAFNNTGKPDMALSYSDSAITVLKDHSLISELTKAYLGKTEVLISLKKNIDAAGTLELAKQLFSKTKSLEDEASYNLLFYRVEQANAQYKKALDYFLAYRNIKDSIDQTVNGKIIQELQLKYNVQKKEIELEKEKSKYLLLEQKNQDERFSKWLSIAILLIVLILVTGSVYYLYSRKLREKQASFSQQLIENIEEDRLRISMDLHDDIGQSLSMIKSKMAVLNPESENKNLETELARVIEQTRELSKNLYPSYLEKIGLVRSIARLMENIQSSTNIECSFDVTDSVEHLSLQTKTHIYRIIQECTNNTIKHAKASALKTSIVEKNNEYVVIYQDNGIGMSHKQKNGLGLLSIKERAKIINGSVNFEDKTNKSFKLTLKFSA
jgi:two-component system NarL family sensor kinase